MILSKNLLRTARRSQKLSSSCFSKAQQTKNSLFRVEEIKQSIFDSNEEETKKLRTLLKKRNDFLQEASVDFYDLEINIDFFYQYNSFRSMYVKSLLDFSNINYAGVR